MKTTIIYENSFGILTQWSAEILQVTQSTISLKFSAKKAFKFDLKANSNFMVVCKEKEKANLLEKNIFESFDHEKREQLLKKLKAKNNLLHYWNGKEFLNFEK